MRKVMTVDEGPLEVTDWFELKGTNRRAWFRRLEDDTIVITYQTLTNKAKRIICTQSIRLSEEAVDMTIQGLLRIMNPSKDRVKIKQYIVNIGNQEGSEKEHKNCKSCPDLISDGSDRSPGGVMFTQWYKCKHTENRMSKIISSGKTLDGTDRPCELPDQEGSQ